MANVQPRTLSGFMELLPARQVQFDRMVAILRESYSLYGFTPLDTPAHRGQPRCCWPRAAARRRSRSTAFTKGDSDLSLRFDLTVPLAKYVALHYGRADLPLPPLPDRQGLPGRAGPAGPLPGVLPGGHRRHRRRHAWTSPTRRRSPPSSIKTFTALGLKRFQIRVNNRKVLNGFYAMLGLDQQSGDDHAHGGQAGQDRPGEGGAMLTGATSGRLRRSRPGDPQLYRHHRHQRARSWPPWRATRGRNELFDLGLDELNAVVRVSGRLRRAGGLTSPWT